jgi:N-carbamoylputrescine amidase
LEINVERILNLGLIQMTCTEDKQENFNKTIGRVERAAKRGAQIICTQELFLTPYFCQVMDHRIFELAQEIHAGSAVVKELGNLAAKLKIVLIAGLFEKRTTGLYHNTAVVMDADGSYLGKYRKMHIPQDPGYLEKFYFTPGDLGYQVFNTKYAKIGVLICWDQWYPEAARLTAMKGAEIIFCPTAIGYSPVDKDPIKIVESQESWQIVQQGHAAANACFLAAVNRVGFESTPGGGAGIQFWGGSFVANPAGQIVRKASSEEEEILVCSIDLSKIEEIRTRESFPFRDRRVDSYQDLTRLYSD